ncbi:glycosyltransferase [Nocardioides sp. BP30]|uniref:glycosyltransferase n=1 Tax=Nocardioides sp. BP30 TaxID=3036374 RepID=UPI002468478D|nr:glycosyltransferase [Nocardioides sp. BP30]WGL51002.1 glycosyltransferase [Nocardioides sp. BP30]
MRILNVIPVMGSGGAETLAEALVLDQLRAGDHSTIASAGGFRLAPLAAAGAEVVPLRLQGRRPADLLASVRRLRAAARHQHPDLVHAHNVKAALVAGLAIGGSAPIMVTVHGVPDRSYAAAAAIVRRAADEVVAVSSDVARRLLASGVPAERLSVIENGIATPHAPDRGPARALLGLPETATVLVCVARMVLQKRHDLLLEAFRRALPSLPADTVLLLVGDGPTRPSVEADVRAAGLSDRVHLLGERDDVPTILAAADLAVLPTSWEGLPISVLEAMALGVPVLASDVGDLRSALGDAIDLVQPGSAELLGVALRDLIRDPARRMRLSASGRATVAARFGAERMLAGYRAGYTGLAGPVSGGSRPGAGHASAGSAALAGGRR